MKVRKAVIPAAGLGTRFLPATKAMPKEMLPIVDKPTLQYIVEECVASGITDILIVTGRGKTAIEDHFDKAYELENELEKKGKNDLLEESRAIWNMVTIHTVRQKEPKGLGHAIACAESFVGEEPFAVLLGDDIVHNEGKPCIKQMIDVFEEKRSSILGVQTVKKEDVVKYGIVDSKKAGERLHKVHGLIEKPAVKEAPSTLAVLGRYIITPAIFDVLKKTKPGKGNEIQITDALLTLSKLEDVYAYDFEGRRYDVGDKQGFLEATVEYALRRDDLGPAFKEYLKRILSE